MARHSTIKAKTKTANASQRTSRKLRSDIQTTKPAAKPVVKQVTAPTTKQESLLLLPTDVLCPPSHGLSGFNLCTIHVAQGSNIESKVKQVLAALDSPTTIASVISRAPAANKCVSIVEIAKREFARTNKKPLFQYTGHWTRLEQMPEQMALPAEHEDSDGFEPVRRAHVRNIPCLVVHLSTGSIARLKGVYR